jgi:hypothetical protein
MTNVQHPEPTTDDLRARLHEIAAEAEIDTSDASEPLHELAGRIRLELQEEFERISDHYADRDAELNEIEDIITDREEIEEDEPAADPEAPADKPSRTTER